MRFREKIGKFKIGLNLWPKARWKLCKIGYFVNPHTKIIIIIIIIIKRNLVYT